MSDGIRIDLEGFEDLEQFLSDAQSLEAGKRVVRQNGGELQQGIVRRADFRKGYQTGTTKRSVQLDFEDDGLTALSGPTTEYSPYLEWGTRFMEAQPFVRPAHDEQADQFRKDMERLVK